MHHIQKSILLKLAHQKTSRFADLKPAGVDSNVFTYHLKQLMSDKLLDKNESGDYCITQKGKLAVINVRLNKKDELEQAHPVIYLTCRNKKGEWLLRKRLVHPAYGKIGFLHVEPVAGETVYETAKRMFNERTTLDADFKARGSGYLTLMRDGELESFTQFTLLVADSFEGELSSPGESGQNLWYSGDFSDPDIFPNMPEIMELLTNSEDIFFVDLVHQI